MVRPSHVLAVALSSGACAKEDPRFVGGRIELSTDVATNQLEGSFRVSGERGEVTLSAVAVFRDHATNVDVVLTGEDRVTVDGVRMTRSSTLELVTLARKRPGETYRFVLHRAAEDIAVDVETIEELTITSPSPSSELQRRDPVTVTWRPSEATVLEAQLFSTCAPRAGATRGARGTSAAWQSSLRVVAESGSITLPPFEPRAVADDPRNAAPCDGTVSLVRTRTRTTVTPLAATETVAEEVHRVFVSLVTGSL